MVDSAEEDSRKNRGQSEPARPGGIPRPAPGAPCLGLAGGPFAPESKGITVWASPAKSDMSGTAVERGNPPVAEDYSQIPQVGPSLSRKGGIRLHPLRDGVIPLTTEARVRRRDIGGNLYTEVTNPSTGMCTGVTSPLTIEGGPVLEPTPVVPVRNPKRDAGLLPQLAGNGVWTQGAGSARRVIRTVDQGDSPLPSLPPRRGHQTRRGAAPSAAQRAGGTPTGGNRGASTRLPNALIDAYILGLAKQAAKGKPLPPVKITPLMRRVARADIARKADIARFCGETPE